MSVICIYVMSCVTKALTLDVACKLLEQLFFIIIRHIGTIIVVRRCTIFSPHRRQASSDFEGLKVCEKRRSGKKKACTKEKYR